MWKGRQVIEGAPTHSQDVSREIEILSLTEEKEGEAIMQVTSDLKTNRRPFAILVDTKILQHVQIRKEPNGKSEFQLIHVLRPVQEGKSRFSYFSWLCWRLTLPEDEIFAESPAIFLKEIEGERGFFVGQTGAARPMSAHRMGEGSSRRDSGNEEGEKQNQEKGGRKEESNTSKIFGDGAYEGRRATKRKPV
jgi:hypothetical protein